MIARNYADAIIEVYKGQIVDVTTLLERFDICVASSTKGREILLSPYTTEAQKLDFIDAMCKELKAKNEGKEPDIDKLSTFLKLLIENERFMFLPEIISILKAAHANATRTYKGILKSREKVSDKYTSELKAKLEKKLNITLELENILADIDGVTLFIDTLYLEVSILKDSIFNRLEKQILTTI